MNSTSYQKFLKNFHKFTEEYNKEVLEKVNNTITISDADKEKLTELFATLSSKAEVLSVKNVNKKKREPTEYNKFMQTKIKELRIAHPDIDKKELMSMGAKEWQKQKAAKAKGQ
jgi:hypothetical protein